MSAHMEDFAGPAGAKLLGISRDTHQRAEQRAGRCLRMRERHRARHASARTRRAFRAAALLEQRFSLRIREGLPTRASCSANVANQPPITPEVLGSRIAKGLEWRTNRISR